MRQWGKRGGEERECQGRSGRPHWPRSPWSTQVMGAMREKRSVMIQCDMPHCIPVLISCLVDVPAGALVMLPSLHCTNHVRALQLQHSSQNSDAFSLGLHRAAASCQFTMSHSVNPCCVHVCGCCTMVYKNCMHQESCTIMYWSLCEKSICRACAVQAEKYNSPCPICHRPGLPVRECISLS
jgi:hypothetical protein